MKSKFLTTKVLQITVHKCTLITTNVLCIWCDNVTPMSSLSPDSTLTVGNVIRAMEKVAVDKRRRVWEEVLGRGAVEQIYSSHSSEENKLHYCADTYANCKPNSSWEDVVRKLYYDCCEMAAAKEAKAFLQQNGGWLL